MVLLNGEQGQLSRYALASTTPALITQSHIILGLGTRGGPSD